MTQVRMNDLDKMAHQLIDDSNEMASQSKLQDENQAK